jgi:hypothetical protein
MGFAVGRLLEFVERGVTVELECQQYERYERQYAAECVSLNGNIIHP